MPVNRNISEPGRTLTGIGFCAALLWMAGISAGAFAAGQSKTVTPTQNKPANSRDATAGTKIYAEQCGGCHYARSTAKKIGPGLKGIYSKTRFTDGKAVSDASMIGWVRNGGKNMPPLADKLNVDEMRELIAYLHTL